MSPATNIETALGEAAVGPFESPWLERPVPLARPASEEALAAVLRRASAEGWRVLPVGGASELALDPPPRRVDLALSLAGLTGVVAHEPGDGTLTARAGTTLAELARVAAAGGHRITPDAPRPERATLGGVLAAGTSGPDRLLRGPARHHVLGMRVALADGRVVKSGGRLVKNVTGFDLFRLHCGARGSLGVIVEASLRLFPAPQSEALALVRAPDLGEALALADQVRRGPVRPLAMLLVHEKDDTQLAIHLAGHAAAVEADLARLANSLGDAEVLRDEAARARAAILRDREPDLERAIVLRVAAPPPALSEVLPPILRVARGSGGGALVASPGIASASVVACPEIDDIDWEGLHTEVRGLRARFAARRLRLALAGGRCALPEQPRDPALARLCARVRAALDPSGVMASDRFRTAPGEEARP